MWLIRHSRNTAKFWNATEGDWTVNRAQATVYSLYQKETAVVPPEGRWTRIRVALV